MLRLPVPLPNVYTCSIALCMVWSAKMPIPNLSWPCSSTKLVLLHMYQIELRYQVWLIRINTPTRVMSELWGPLVSSMLGGCNHDWRSLAHNAGSKPLDTTDDVGLPAFCKDFSSFSSQKSRNVTHCHARHQKQTQNAFFVHDAVAIVNTRSDRTAQVDTLQHVNKLWHMVTQFGSSSHVQQPCSTINPCLHCQLSSKLHIFAYLYATGHVGDVT